MIKFEFKGGKELEAALMELKTATAKGVARRVMKRHAQKFADAANDAAPVSPDENLKGSYVVGSRGALNRTQRRGAKADMGEVTLHAGTNDPAGVQQEFGNSRHAAQPHARPAWESTKDGILEGIQDDMMAEVQKSAARARK